MKTVMVFGTFDILHPGHFNFFKQARQFGRLIVVIARDQTVKKVKGFSPIHSEKYRQRMVRKIAGVNQTVLGGIKDQMKIIKRYKPDIIGLGYDQRAFVEELRQNFPDLKIIRLQSYKPQIYKTSKFKLSKNN